MQEIADYSLMYPQLLALYYRYTGDAAALLPYYETALGMIRHFAQYERADGLLVQVADKWNLVDWPENLRDDYDFALTRPVVGAGCHNVINALYLGAKKTLNGLARVLGREDPYELEKPVLAYRRAFYRKETGLLADSETSSHTSLHSNVYALYFGLLEEAEEAPVIEFLEKRGFSCGVMLSYYLLLALARRGRYESVYRLLLNDSDHGWCNMLREGATTCFEAWGKDQKWNTSLCHPWASAPVPVILEEIAGIHLSPEGRCDFCTAYSKGSGLLPYVRADAWENVYRYEAGRGNPCCDRRHRAAKSRCKIKEIPDKSYREEISRKNGGRKDVVSKRKQRARSDRSRRSMEF